MNKFAALITVLFFSFSTYSFAETTEEQLKKELEALTKNLPMQLDDVTSLTSILISPQKTIRYTYSFDFDKVIGNSAKQARISTDQLITNALNRYGTVDQWLKAWGDEYVAPLYNNQNCTTPATIRFIESGFTIIHRVYDTQGNFLYEHEVTQNTCENLLTPKRLDSSTNSTLQPVPSSPKASYEEPPPISGKTFPLPPEVKTTCEFKAVMTAEDMQQCGISQ